MPVDRQRPREQARRRASTFPPRWYLLRACAAQDQIRLADLAKGEVCVPSVPSFHCSHIFYGTLPSVYIISHHTSFVKVFAGLNLSGMESLLSLQEPFPLLNSSQRTQGSLLRLGQSSDPSDIQALVRPVAS